MNGETTIFYLDILRGGGGGKKKKKEGEK